MDPGNIFFEHVELDDADDKQNVDDDGDPCRLAPARTGEIVLQLNEQVRDAGIVIQDAISGFPAGGIVKAHLFRLRLLRRSDRILEWNLCDRHELKIEPSLSVR